MIVIISGATHTGKTRLAQLMMEEYHYTASLAVMRKCDFENVFTGIGLYQGVEQKIVKNVWRVKK